jgi:hypothetical protein
MTRSRKPSRPPLTWQCDVPFLTHPAMLRSLVMMFGVSAFIVISLVGGIIALTEGVKHALPMVSMGLMITGGLFVLSVVIILVVFGNRLSMSFVIDDRGVNARVIDKRARTANRLAAIVGVLAGRPGVAGAGLIAMGSEEMSTVWSGIASARYDPRRHTITLRNDWRPVIYVFCTPETYKEAAGRIAEGLAGARRPRRHGRNPLWRTLGLTLVVILAVLPLFGMPYPFEPHLFSIIFVLCFALATVWLVPLMGWPVLGGIAWIAVTLALQGLEPHAGLFSGDTYTGFGSLDIGEWVGFGIACTGLVVLAAIAVAALRGRMVSLLMSDMLKMGGKGDP